VDLNSAFQYTNTDNTDITCTIGSPPVVFEGMYKRYVVNRRLGESNFCKGSCMSSSTVNAKHIYAPSR